MKNKKILFIIALISLIASIAASCNSDVYGDDSNIKLQERPKYPAITSTWNFKEGKITVKDAVLQLPTNYGGPKDISADIQAQIEPYFSPLLSKLADFEASFKFGILGKVEIKAMKQSFVGGTYKFDAEKNILDYILEINEIKEAQIPKLGPAPLSFKIEMASDKSEFNGTADIKAIILPMLETNLKESLKQQNIPDPIIDAMISNMKIELFVKLKKNK